MALRVTTYINIFDDLNTVYCNKFSEFMSKKKTTYIARNKNDLLKVYFMKKHNSVYLSNLTLRYTLTAQKFVRTQSKVLT